VTRCKRRGSANGTAWFCLVAVSVTAHSAGPAGIKLDGTLGGPAAALAGPNYNITQSLGRLSGGNLFFSFQYFNVATGETALFTTSSAGINNVISRVTGGYASSIDGTIRLQAASGTPNFFLINPGGVTFTSNAVVDVPAAFYVSSANYLKFADGNFYVDPGKMSTLSAAAPEAFGFLGSTRAPVNVQGARLTGGSNGAGDFDITAGDVTIDGGGASSGIYQSSGEIRVVAVGNAVAEVPLSGPFSATDGTVTIRGGGLLWSEGSGATPGAGVSVSAGSLLIDGEGLANITGVVAGDLGAPGPINVAIGNDARIANGGLIFSSNSFAVAAARISLSAGTLTIDGANGAGNTGILSSAFGTGSGADVQVAVKGAATISSDGAIYTSAAGQGNAGDISLSAGALSIEPTDPTLNTGLQSITVGAGNAGSIEVSADTLTMSAPPAASGLSGTILTAAYPGSTGSGGAVTVDVSGNVSLTGAAGILSYTEASGNAGLIAVDAGGTVAIGAGSQIFSNNYAGSGNGGNVVVTASALNIVGQASSGTTGISTTTETAATGGSISIKAGSLSIDGASSNLGFTGIQSIADGAGRSGAVQVDIAGQATISNGGFFLTTANAQGNAGDITLSAGNLLLQDVGNGNINTGILSNTFGAGASGSLQINSGSLTLNAPPATNPLANPVAIYSSPEAGSSGKGGDVAVNVAGPVSLNGPTAISTTTYSSGAAGNVSITAQGTVSLLGGGLISSESFGGSGNAGGITLNAPALDIEGHGAAAETGMAADSSGPGTAGDVAIRVGTLLIDGGTGTGLTDIEAFTNGNGAGGQIQIAVAGNATLADGGEIFTDSYAQGNAGSIALSAGSLVIDAQRNGSNFITGIQAETYGAGNAGSIQIKTGSLTVNSYTGAVLPITLSSDANPGSTGNAGAVNINVEENLAVNGNASLSSNSLSSGNAGQVSVVAGGTISLLDGAYISSIANTTTGNAGDISVSAAAINIEGQGAALTGISTESFGTGNSGTIRVHTGSLLIEGGTGAAIDSEVFPKGTAGVGGAGGSIDVDVSGKAVLQNGSKISTTSFGSGPAGDVNINAGTLLLGGGASRSIISSGARAGSGGQPGNVRIDAGLLEVLSNGSINIADNATISAPGSIKPTQIAISAGQIDLNDGLITAASTGNIAASAITINYSSALRMDPSTISTSSQDGNGGPISITGEGPLLMGHSSITTSVLGASNGNGGDINIEVPVMVLDTGFIQANTFAPIASGGTIRIDARALVPSEQSFVLGGNALAFDPTAQGLNVVQAAAPDGFSGTLNVTVPTLDLGNALLGLTGRPSAAAALGRSACGFDRGNAFVVAGRGGVAPTAYDPLWVGPVRSRNPQASAVPSTGIEAARSAPCR
jgi:filamentous hemagglutinin family protein